MCVAPRKPAKTRYNFPQLRSEIHRVQKLLKGRDPSRGIHSSVTDRQENGRQTCRSRGTVPPFCSVLTAQGFYWLLIFVTLLFLVLRAWVRYFLQRKRPNLSDLFVLLAWLGYTANGIANLMMSILQFEFSSGGSSSDVSVQASPEKLVQVLKVSYPHLFRRLLIMAVNLRRLHHLSIHGMVHQSVHLGVLL